RRPWFAVGWFWYLVTLLPVSGLIQVGIHSRADRYTYVPLIGVFIALTWGIAEIVMRWQRSSIWRPVVWVGAGMLVIACAVQTRVQLAYWENCGKLFRHVLTVTKDNYQAYNNLGAYLLDKRQLNEAIENCRRALELNPDCALAHNNL